MQSVRDTAPPALRLMLNDQPTTPAKVRFAWQVAAGPAMGRAATIDWSPEGTMTVRARDAAWRREIAHAKPMLLERLRHLLGPNVVRRIVVPDVPPSASS